MPSLKCDHCLLEFPDRDAVYDELSGKQHVFCCHGCNGIFRLIHDEGLDRFYEKRKWGEVGISSTLFTREPDLAAFADQVRDAVQAGVEETNRACLKEIDISIDGIRCASCVWLNEKVLSRTSGVAYARINYATHRARIRWDPSLIGLDLILKRILSIGYNPKPYSESEQFRTRRAETRDLLIRFGTAGFLSSQLMMYTAALYAGYFQGIDAQIKLFFEIIAMLLTLPVVFYSGMPFISSTFRALRGFRFNMDSLITIGAGSAFLYSVYQISAGGEVYFDTSAMIITLILLGRYIEATAKGRASETIERLSELAPRDARVLCKADEAADGLVSETATLPITSIKAGAFIRVAPGERIPLDGIVTAGESEVDESVLTGESRPVAKLIGSEVIGGTMNMYGSLVFRVTRTGKDTVLAGIIRAVEDAQAHKPRLQTVADRLVGLFVPAILTAAVLTVLGYLISGASVHHALMTGISVLVIACPCSLGLATPLAVLVFTSRASSHGILIRSGEVIENAAAVTQVVFDKTGTVTEGRPALKEMIVIGDEAQRDYILSVASSIEELSEHSLGHAVARAAQGTARLAVTDFKALPGKGVEATVDGCPVKIGNRSLMASSGVGSSAMCIAEDRASDYEVNGDTVIFMTIGSELKALFVVSDLIRPEAREVFGELRSSGLEVSIVSGDNLRTTNAIAASVGSSDALAETSPVGKRDVVAALQSVGKKVMMIGDGINDAPALTESAVGVAMGRGTDIAMESADAVLVRNDLKLVPFFLSLSRRTLSVIKQNIFWALIYNVIAIPLAVAGVLHPIVAAAAMAASSLFVVFNSLRIKQSGR